MTFTIQNVIDSIAVQLASIFPDYPIKQSPSLDTEFPCFFIFMMPGSIADEIDGYQARSLGFDIVFVQQRNVPDQNVELIKVLEALETHFDMLTYTDGLFSVPLHVLTREASIEDQELHYKITLKQRVSFDEVKIPLQEMEELNVEAKGG